MFWNKKMKAEIADLQAFEKGVCKIIDGYFKTNEQAEVRYSMDNGVDKFWHFVKSVDDRLKSQGQAISGLLETLVKTTEENEVLKAELAKECEEHQQFCETAKKKVDEQQAIINAQEKEINELRKPKTETAKGGKK